MPVIALPMPVIALPMPAAAWGEKSGTVTNSERTISRKLKEALIALRLEDELTKDQILEIYLNNVEWGEGVFGAEAAAQHYFRVDADQLAPIQAARLAVMLPAP